MSVILSFIVDHFDAIALLLAFGIMGGFIVKNFIKNVKKDGYQASDCSTSVIEGVADYKALMTNIENVIEDVTINDADTLAAIKTFLLSMKTFK